MTAATMATLSAADSLPLSAEEALLERAQSNDREAFRSLFERHSPTVRRYLRDLLGDESAADEATQETFVRAHRRLDTLRDALRLRSWLLGIAHRVFLEQCRQRRQSLESTTHVEPNLESIAPTPELALLGREAESVLAAALARLSDERRSVLLLRLDHELSYDCIAEEMGWPIAKVKNEIHRARLLLRSYLSQYIGGAL